MSDLISRKKVIDLMYQVFEKNSMATDKNSPLGGFGAELFKSIKELPTAYDIDKVVEELKLHSFEFGTDSIPAHYLRFNEAIEIVNQGGVSDDVCEWKSVKLNYEWKPSCESNSTYNVCGVAWFKRCPYCGKKIKVVE